MKFLTKENLILALLVFVILQGFFKSPEGISPEEELYRLKIHDLNQEKTILLQSIDTLETKINTFKDERTKIDSVTDGYTTNQLDSFYTDYFSR